MANKGAQTDPTDTTHPDDHTMSTPSSTSKPPSSPPPAHNHQGPYNIHRIHKVHAGASRINSSPSIRQSWLFPTNRASPSTALPETTSVMTVSQRPQNARSEHPPLSTSSSSAASAYAVSPTLSSKSAMHQKRNFSGSARSRLTKIDRLSKMMLNPNASAPSLLDTSSSPFPPASPRRARLSQLHKDTSSAPDPPLSSLSSLSSVSSESNSGTKGATSSNICPLPHQQISAQTPYPRHIIMSSSSPETIDGDALSSSLPSAPAFPDGVEISSENNSSTTSSNDKSSRHASMPLPRPGWRLYDVLDHEDGDQHDHDGSGSGFGSSSTDEHHSFQYSASNASSTSNLAHHGRQDSISSFYTATPNASNLDLSLGPSLNNLNTLDNSISDSHLSTSPSQTSYASSYNLPQPPQLLPKAVRNNKSPLALKRSSTTSNSSASPSNTYASKGSMPKSSLSNDAPASKTLTLERQKFIVEILRTERSYVDGLVVLQTLFYEPLNAPYATNSSSGMNTTTSFNLNTTHSYKYNNNSTINSFNNTSNPNINTGPTPTSPYYATSTMGSNSTLSAAAAPLLSKKSVNEIFSNFSEILQVNTLLLTQLETRICGTTFSTGWESDEDEDGVREGQDEGQEEDYHEDSAHGRKPNQVLVTVGSQGGELEQLLVLDQDWCVGDIFIEIVRISLSNIRFARYRRCFVVQSALLMHFSPLCVCRLLS